MKNNIEELEKAIKKQGEYLNLLISNPEKIAKENPKLANKINTMVSGLMSGNPEPFEKIANELLKNEKDADSNK